VGNACEALPRRVAVSKASHLIEKVHRKSKREALARMIVPLPKESGLYR
jgi:hypothetical protein